MPVVVSDASVLISLGATGHIDLLKDFYQTVVVPNAVWQEITGSPLPLPGTTEAKQARQEGWLRVETPRNRALVSSLAASLDIGEAEAITLASELGAALLLIDESDGRAAVLLETRGTFPAAAENAAAAGGRSGDGARGIAQSERLLADEHEQHRASRAHERVVGQTRGAGPAGALGRLSLPAAAEGGAESSGAGRGGVNTAEPPDADPHVRWCGGRGLITPGYPISRRKINQRRHGKSKLRAFRRRAQERQMNGRNPSASH